MQDVKLLDLKIDLKCIENTDIMCVTYANCVF